MGENAICNVWVIFNLKEDILEHLSLSSSLELEHECSCDLQHADKDKARRWQSNGLEGIWVPERLHGANHSRTWSSEPLGTEKQIYLLKTTHYRCFGGLLDMEASPFPRLIMGTAQ